MADESTITRWHKQLLSDFQNAHSAWQTSDQLVHRLLRPVVDPKLGDMAAGADYRTPDLEEEEQRLVEFMSQRQVDFDGRPGEDTPTGRQEAENAQLWFSRWWAEENKGGRVTEMWAAGQARHGLKAWRLLTRNLEEPDEGVDRDEWMQTRDSVFYVRNANNSTVFWDPIANPYTRIVMEYEITVAQARDDYRVDGGDLGGDYEKGKYYVPIHDQKGIGWVSDEEDPMRVEKESTGDQKLTVTVCEYRDDTKPCPICPDKHALWVGCEYIRQGGQEFKDAKRVREYVLPWKKWPSLRVTEGRTSAIDLDPHDHYRPLMIKLLVEAATWNWCNAMLLAVANKDMTDGFYAQLNTQVPQEAVGMLEGMSVEIPDNTVDQVDVVPAQVLKWPERLTESLITLRDAAYERFQAAKLPGVLFGDVVEEATKMPGASLASIQHAARIPLNRPIMKQDMALVDTVEDIKHAILFLDHGAEKGTEQRFYVKLDGDEGGTPGEKVYLSASRLSTRPQVSVVSNPETLAEQKEREASEWNLYLQGAKTWDQYLKAIGFKDVEAQNKMLDEEQQRRESRQMFTNARVNYMLQISADLMDSDASVLMSNPLGVVAAGTAPAQPPAPNDGGNSASAAIGRLGMSAAGRAQGG